MPILVNPLSGEGDAEEVTEEVSICQAGEPPWKFLSGGCRANDRGGQGLVGKLMQILAPPTLVLLEGGVGEWSA